MHVVGVSHCLSFMHHDIMLGKSGGPMVRVGMPHGTKHAVQGSSELHGFSRSWADGGLVDWVPQVVAKNHLLALLLLATVSSSPAQHTHPSDDQTTVIVLLRA